MWNPVKEAELQWGRDLSIAESGPLRYPMRNIPLASMGPRSFDRGKCIFSLLFTRPLSLQWGRDLSIAERPCASSTCAHCLIRFNGAAIFRSRKAGGVAGRDGGELLASMGPRSFDRGKPDMGLAFRSLSTVLQWGRDLSIAESARSWRDRLDQITASMGPRSFDRGKQIGAVVIARIFHASMGPRSFDRGKRSSGASHQGFSPRFNGAAIFRSRKVLGITY